MNLYLIFFIQLVFNIILLISIYIIYYTITINNKYIHKKLNFLNNKINN